MTTEFRKHIQYALTQREVQANTKNVVYRLRNHRRAALSDQSDWQRLRRQSTAIRTHAVDKLPQLLELLEDKLTQNGIRVHWAETTEQANQIVLTIMQQHNA